VIEGRKLFVGKKKRGSLLLGKSSSEALKLFSLRRGRKAPCPGKESPTLNLGTRRSQI